MHILKTSFSYLLLFILSVIGSAIIIAVITVVYAYVYTHFLPHTSVQTVPKLMGHVINFYMISTCVLFVSLLLSKPAVRKPKTYFIWFSLLIPYIALYAIARMLFSFQFTDEHFLPDNQMTNYSRQPDIIDDSNMIPR